MLLYEAPGSPYAQKIKIALREKSIPFDVELPPTLGTGRTDGPFGVGNPRAEVPMLVDGETHIFGHAHWHGGCGAEHDHPIGRCCVHGPGYRPGERVYRRHRVLDRKLGFNRCDGHDDRRLRRQHRHERTDLHSGHDSPARGRHLLLQGVGTQGKHV